MLQVRDLSVEVGGRLTLSGATFAIRAGEKVGLVGRNGAGKTSMLRVLAGERPPAVGTVTHQGGLGYLNQDPRVQGVDPGTLAVDHVLSGRGLDEAAIRIEKLRLRVEEDPSERNVARYSRAEEEYRIAGGYAGNSEARRMAAGLGLPADRMDMPLSVLSGGERRRVELARILFAGSDLLILDEPTNHLDVDAKSWLMSFLRTYRGALLVVSHDLELLDEAISRVLHLDDGELIAYKGTYSEYVSARAKDEERRAKLAARQKAEIDRLSSLAAVMVRQTEKRAKTGKSIEKRVERLRDVAIEGPKRDRGYRVRFPEPPHCGKLVLDVVGLAKSYGEREIFSDVSFDLGKGERLLILGLNGAGKTSMLRILAGVSESSGGTIRLGTGVTLGYYAQEHEGIASGVDVISHMKEMSPFATEQDLRSLIGMFGLGGDMAFQDAGTLSGGEKTRLALAQLVAGRNNLLLLDEPTNNLDPASRDAVAQALAAWPGTLIVVSHDTSFVEELQPDRAIVMPEGTLDAWSDDLLDLVALA
ncbi:MAG TPA: ABC-F family ATP-binding cassette domain-containing protein [Acidimicrobiales bacterium]|nr:ABC-F family ATP-binding cassette domain-containing protein [Acidimicrobiales bacterium]